MSTSTPMSSHVSLSSFFKSAVAAKLIEESGVNQISDLTSSELAIALDKQDEVKDYRDQFYIPRAQLGSDEGPDSIYLCGNSLGLQPKRTAKYMTEELTKWQQFGVEGHFLGQRPWATIDETVTGMAAQLVGAENEHEVAVMNSLSANLHLLLISFYRPTPKRYKIFIEEGAFCSDYHVVKSQILLHGYDPATSLVTMSPRDGETFLRTEDIIQFIQDNGDEIATVLFPGVQFYTGQRFDIPAITKAALDKGCRVGFDLAHAVGNVPLKLHDWNVDFAAWCTYKYLNSGPGCIGGAFVHSKHNTTSLTELPRLSGWWGQKLQDRFAMDSEWRYKLGAQSYQLSNPPVVAVVCHQAGLEVHVEAGLEKLRKKSQGLTGYLEALLKEVCGVQSKEDSNNNSNNNDSNSDKKIEKNNNQVSHNTEQKSDKITIHQLTPRDPESRGCQLSLLFSVNVSEINELLLKKGIICDVRKPNVLRVSPTPLYNTYSDVRQFVYALRDVVKAVQNTSK